MFEILLELIQLSAGLVLMVAVTVCCVAYAEVIGS